MKQIILTFFLTLTMATTGLAQNADGTANQRYAAQVVSQEFLKSFLNGSGAVAYEFTHSNLRTHLSQAKLVELAKRNIETGRHTPDFNLTSLTWYTQAGLLAAVDYMASDERNTVFSCGYLIWKFGDGAAPRLTRFDHGTVTIDQFEKMTYNQRLATLQQFRCPAIFADYVLGLPIPQ